EVASGDGQHVPKPRLYPPQEGWRLGGEELPGPGVHPRAVRPRAELAVLDQPDGPRRRVTDDAGVLEPAAHGGRELLDVAQADRGRRRWARRGQEGPFLRVRLPNEVGMTGGGQRWHEQEHVGERAPARVGPAEDDQHLRERDAGEREHPERVGAPDPDASPNQQEKARAPPAGCEDLLSGSRERHEGASSELRQMDSSPPLEKAEQVKGPMYRAK